MKFVAPLAVALGTLTVAAPASAQFAKPEDAVKYRQSALFVMAQHFGRIGAMANGRVPFDGAAAAANAEVVADMAKLPWAGFGAGTDKISQKAKFKEHSDKLVAETAKLLAAAKTNNLDNLKAAFGPAANTCKACHDAYRNN
jgi:cytochrome c556